MVSTIVNAISLTKLQLFTCKAYCTVEIVYHIYLYIVYVHRLMIIDSLFFCKL
jgi:hypothetical protein